MAMQTNGLYLYAPGTNPPCDPHYAHCWDAYNPNPLNSRRMAFTSQIQTTGYDPSVKQIIPYTNITACLRISSRDGHQTPGGRDVT